MSLVDKLMSIDKGEYVKEETAEIKSRRLSKIMGEDVYIKVKGISGDLYTELSSRIYNSDGTVDFSKSRDAAALMAAEAVVEPDLKNEDLQAHFDAVTSKDLAKILFKGNELTNIVQKIRELSGFEDEDETVDEIKN